MVTKIITVFNQKGGCGKTTVAMHVAGTLGLRGQRVKIVDADPQSTATRWHSLAKEDAPFPARIANLSAMGAAIHREIKADVSLFDFIVVDCPPSVDSPVAGSALLVSDLAIIPVVPSPSDLWAVVGAKKLALQAQSMNLALKALVVCTMAQPQKTSLDQSVRDILDEDATVPRARSQLGFRSVYRECQALGTTVHSVARARPAVEEVEALVREIVERLGVAGVLVTGVDDSTGRRNPPAAE